MVESLLLLGARAGVGAGEKNIPVPVPRAGQSRTGSGYKIFDNSLPSSLEKNHLFLRILFLI